MKYKIYPALSERLCWAVHDHFNFSEELHKEFTTVIIATIEEYAEEGLPFMKEIHGNN